MKYLVVLGCSHAVGTGLDLTISHDSGGNEFRIKNRWSKLLSDKLNLEEINLGRDGGSNWQIYHNLMSWILSNQEKINETLFVISWTYADRNYIDLVGDFFGPGDKLIYSSKAHFDKNSTISYIPNELADFTNHNFYKWDNLWDEAVIKTSLLYMTGLTSFLSNQNLKYLHFHSDFFMQGNPNGKLTSIDFKGYSKYMAKYIDLFDTKNYISDEFYRWYCHSDRLIPPKYNFSDGHIGPEGQREWANYLYQQLIDREIYNV
jgi:hypothetical protein